MAYILFFVWLLSLTMMPGILSHMVACIWIGLCFILLCLVTYTYQASPKSILSPSPRLTFLDENWSWHHLHQPVEESSCSLAWRGGPLCHHTSLIPHHTPAPTLYAKGAHSACYGASAHTKSSWATPPRPTTFSLSPASLPWYISLGFIIKFGWGKKKWRVG